MQTKLPIRNKDIFWCVPVFPTLYWLPKLHKRPYKARFIANSCSCTTTELSKLLTSCLTAIKKNVIKYCDKVYEWSGKNLFWSIKNSNEVLNKLKSRRFRASSLSTYDFSTLYTTLLHNLIKEQEAHGPLCSPELKWAKRALAPGRPCFFFLIQQTIMAW